MQHVRIPDGVVSVFYVQTRALEPDQVYVVRILVTAGRFDKTG